MTEKSTTLECAFGDLSDAATKAALLRDALRRNQETSGRPPVPKGEER